MKKRQTSVIKKLCLQTNWLQQQQFRVSKINLKVNIRSSSRGQPQNTMATEYTVSHWILAGLCALFLVAAWVLYSSTFWRRLLQKKIFLPGIMINFSEFDHRTKNSTTAIANYQFVKIALFIKNVKLELKL